ncbi:MAG TPA: 3-hydroxyacyl-ACP dehydratase FabZ [Caldisericia bacterium]|nr:3-hydroxyacyl-ACP dehydratase FabZ [Caldisericia bacterium]HPF49197.1 3-hydroxyacyl-ACP dehydratase FabZ [Caldisericia bacterium]HPI84124.1 3-hydroxyacyl-ACP dehydratase FabZ [Caldisericia bacterium]HPQ93381.1 3-hydroxyacyl-ACP dehydratase FabZ [Caldisericia bacterium]HRV75237.1 3-hydroxyacyl-ACP dehydratase FabZ [Caldisericia bacterium]
MLDSVEIQKILPHRFPFLMIDKILEVEPGVRAVGVKNVTNTEPHFQGHFPGLPTMPGVLIVEAMAQVGAVCGLLLPEYKGAITYFTGIDNLRFKKPVVPGDVIRIEVVVEKIRMGVFKCRATATVDGEEVVTGTLMAALRKVER